MLSETKLLSYKEKKLITINCLLAVGMAFGSYLVARWTVSFDNPLLYGLIQSCAQVITHMIAYYIVSYLSSKIKVSYLFGISFIVAVIGYIVFVLLASAGKITQANIAYGILMGLYNGAYFACYNQISYSLTSSKSRISYFAVNGSVTTLFSFAGPILMILTLVGLNAGEVSIQVYIVFLVATSALYLICAILSLTLGLPRSIAKIEIRHKFYSVGDKLWNTFSLYNIFYGLFLSITGACGLVFIMCFNKALSVYYLCAWILSILLNCLGNYFFAKILRKVNKAKLFAVCSCFSIGVFLVAGLFVESSLALVIGCIAFLIRGIFDGFRFQLDMSLQTAVMDRYTSVGENPFSRYLVRETMIGIPRILFAIVMLVMAMFLDTVIVIIIVSAVGLVIFNTLAIVCFIKVLRLLNITKSTAQ